jgi:hypothetical protein
VLLEQQSATTSAAGGAARGATLLPWKQNKDRYPDRIVGALLAGLHHAAGAATVLPALHITEVRSA